jgi:hypothetical protein
MKLIKKNIARLTSGLKKKYSKRPRPHAVFLEFYRLNGAVVDAIEYFLYMKSIGINIKLCVYNRFNKLYSPDITKLYRIIEDRYDIRFDYKDDIKFYERTWDFIKDKYDTILILDRSSIEVFPLLNANRVIFFHDFSKMAGTESLYEKLQTFDHIKVYHEMPFALTKDFSTQTNLKMAFSLFKQITLQKHNYFMNLLSKGSISSVQNVLRSMKNIDYLFVTANDRNHEMLLQIKDTRLVIWTEHPRNFFGSFGKYIYSHDGDYFDPRPRMFHECMFYDKPILYINEQNIKDGSWYRYHDVIENPQAIMDRTLTPDDTIIGEFL